MTAPQLYLTTGMSLEVQLSQMDENVNGRFLVSAMITVRSTIANNSYLIVCRMNLLWSQI